MLEGLHTAQKHACVRVQKKTKLCAEDSIRVCKKKTKLCVEDLICYGAGRGEVEQTR
jgi:hypothetical protein